VSQYSLLYALIRSWCTAKTEKKRKRRTDKGIVFIQAYRDKEIVACSRRKRKAGRSIGAR